MEQFLAFLSDFRALAVVAYARAPALMLVLSALLMLPLLAVGSLMARKTAHASARRQALRRMPPSAAPDATAAMPADTDAIPATAVLRLPRARLARDGKAIGPLPSPGALIRIGRHRDNDIRIPDKTVHRFHALVHRTEDAGFVITDLSGHDGNGVRINGKRLAEARLADGDLIELGKVQLTFEHEPN